MDDYRVDYHIHTTASDGKATPTEIIKKAKELEYDVIAITDHDNTDGLMEAKIAGEAVGLKVVSGIELAVQTEEGIGLHILGYNIDQDNPELKDFLENIIQKRRKRNEKLFKVLKEIGYNIGEEDIQMGKNEYIGKPLIARALVDKGYIKDEIDAYGREILGSKACRDVKREKATAQEAIDIIKQAGGTAVLAHPIQTRGIGRPGSEEFFANIEKIIRKLKIGGLAGLECFHPDQNFEQSMRFIEIAEKLHLHITRGSDFHGDDFSMAEKTANEVR